MQAVIAIGTKQWQVQLATTPWEQVTGLGGIASIPPGTGMLFDLGYDQIIAVTTVPMLFSLDIAFISDSLTIVDAGRDVPPGLVISSSVPARFFLEVNANELEGIDTGDRVYIQPLADTVPQPIPDWVTAMFSFMVFAMAGIFIVSIARMFIKAAFAEPEKKPALYGPKGEKLLPQTKSELKEKWYEKGVEAGKTDGWMAVEDTLSETLRDHRGIIRNYEDLVWTDIDLWEETEHFNVFYDSKMWKDALEAAGGDADKGIEVYFDLRDEFWEGYLTGRKQIGIDIYKKASELVKSPNLIPQTRHERKVKLAKPTRYEVTVESWQERDRLGIWITDNRTGQFVAEWWDDEAREMFEQGFFKPGVPQYSWEKPGREFVDSVLNYAETQGLLARASSPGTTSLYLPQTSTATKLNGLQIVRAYKQISRHGEDRISVSLEAWAIFPRGKKPHLVNMYRSGDKYVISPLHAHITEWVEVPADKVRAWIKSLPVCHFGPMAVAPQYREEAERLAKEVDEPIDIIPLPSRKGASTYMPGEIAEYKEERVRVRDQIGGKVQILIPSRQEEVWVEEGKLKKLELLPQTKSEMRKEREKALIKLAAKVRRKRDEFEAALKAIGIDPWYYRDTATREELHKIWEEHPHILALDEELYKLQQEYNKLMLSPFGYQGEEEEEKEEEEEETEEMPQTTKDTNMPLQAVVPIEPLSRQRHENSKLKYFADSPEFLTQTVDSIGYREKIDKTFREAIARAKGLKQWQ